MYMYIYLTTRVALTKTETLRILVSTVTGLVHLHTEIFGTQVKSIPVYVYGTTKILHA